MKIRHCWELAVWKTKVFLSNFCSCLVFMSSCFLGVFGYNHAHKVPKSHKGWKLKFVLWILTKSLTQECVQKFKPLTSEWVQERKELIIESSWKDINLAYHMQTETKRYTELQSACFAMIPRMVVCSLCSK